MTACGARPAGVSLAPGLVAPALLRPAGGEPRPPHPAPPIAVDEMLAKVNIFANNLDKDFSVWAKGYTLEDIQATATAAHILRPEAAFLVGAQPACPPAQPA